MGDAARRMAPPAHPLPYSAPAAAGDPVASEVTPQSPPGALGKGCNRGGTHLHGAL